jgi:carbonic anhydrase
MLTFKTPDAVSLAKKGLPEHSHAAVDAIGDFLEFSDVFESTKKDVEVLKTHPLVRLGTDVSGYVYHVETGKLEKVA